jgi:NAD(P)H-quinone oxidoreductase subunit 2
MMVVKEPQEMSDVVKNYPEIRWNLQGMRPLQVSIVLTLVATTLAGILSNPLFNLANDAVTKTPMLRSALSHVKPVADAKIESNLLSRRD